MFCFPLWRIDQFTHWKHVPSPLPLPSIKAKPVCFGLTCHRWAIHLYSAKRFSRLWQQGAVIGLWLETSVLCPKAVLEKQNTRHCGLSGPRFKLVGTPFLPYLLQPLTVLSPGFLHPWPTFLFISVQGNGPCKELHVKAMLVSAENAGWVLDVTANCVMCQVQYVSLIMHC